MNRAPLAIITFCIGFSGTGLAEDHISNITPPARLPLSLYDHTHVDPSPRATADFKVPLPAHAQPSPQSQGNLFQVESGRKGAAPMRPRETGSAEYRLPEDKKKNPITPENANLNIPADMVITATDTGESISLPAGTYRQIMQLPMDSPLMDENTRTRDLKSPTIETGEPKSRYAEPSVKPIWVRYESLEKIKIGEVERRGGLDVPSHGPKNLGPRVWYAKSETADLASSAFYFVFGGLGYGIANLAGWSAGNTREIPNDFEYRLIRK